MVNNTSEIIKQAIAESWKELAIVITDEDFTEFPLEILDLVNLRSLSISRTIKYGDAEAIHTVGNQLSSLADATDKGLVLHELSQPAVDLIPQLGTLKTLDRLQLVFWGMSSSHLKSVPREISRLKKLESLDLSNNHFTDFPTAVCSLTNLRSLDLSDNRISGVPAEIGQLTELRTLYLSNSEWSLGSDNVANHISALPSTIRNLTQLRELDLQRNPVVGLPPEILNRTYDPRAILSYYFDHQKRPLHEVKLIVVGQGSVGKTSLVQRILYDKFNPGELKTEGIAISRWQVASTSDSDSSRQKADVRRKNGSQTGDQSVQPSDSSIRINVWDFGGQEIMHATHQFFLTKRSLYLLVVDSRLTQEENRIEYWLKIIQSFGGESPVLIVGNKTDQHPLDIDRTGLRNKYPNVRGVFETSASTGAGISGLQISIAEQVNALPHVRDLLPETWFTIKTRLETLGHDKNYINHEEYLSLCNANEVLDDLSQNTLIGFLHDLGVILHFQEDPRLEALGILNPKWVTDGVYKILNSHQLFQNKGVLTLPILNDTLDLSDYPRDKRLFIVDMMRKFELCYDIEANQTFLVPDLLPKDEPYTSDWTDSLAFQYHYNVLPGSIITRFIVRMNPFIYKTVWRSGVVLKSGPNTALVKADTEDRKIFVWVGGNEPTRRDFLSAIRSQFDAIHQTIAKIEAREKVPVPGAPNVVVDYQHLLKLELKGVRELIPEGLDEPIPVRHLLDGIATLDDRQQDLLGTRRTVPENSRKERLVANDGSARLVPANRSLLLRALTIVFVSTPRIIGRTILDLFGRDKAADSTSIILGYALVVLVLLLLWGVVDPHVLLNGLKNLWRFFFPLKS
jgi:internalin A